ncbi:MAG: hypothetical protein RL135_2385, partial [Bacteroidota bacterium]
MSKKNIADQAGFVYSTDPNFQFNRTENEALETLEPAKQNLMIQL